jgi:hypothetical protein
MSQLHVLLDWIEATVNASKESVSEGVLFQYDQKEKKKEEVSQQVTLVATVA